ncbi:MobH family relaxase [Methylomonas sp. MS20]|uniref:MobH family relaxase n=1 Tax=Methylomonas sp. MS20 TaxID=3418769 RepID=UPI003D058E65
MENATSSFIQRISQRLWGDKPALVSAPPASSGEEIPRYPPFMKGLPAASVERVLATQSELIQSIEQALALPDALYQAIALPVITRYAAFSHLLPASESHHHRGAGGLFRHGLEVAHWATLASHGCLFASDATPKSRKTLEPRWRLAVCFAGLLHDIGKPVSDIAVTDSQGLHTWNPCDENLIDWAAQHRIDRYFLRWRENRHKRHQQFSALVIERVLTRESRAYLLEPGPEIMQALLETLHGLDRGSKLYELVVTADCKSVERDLKTHAHSVDAALGMPVERYLFDAMRRLIKSGQWLVNDKGARVWRFQSGVHIVWRTGAQDIVGLLAKDKVPGIPRDEDTLADILIERGLAIPKRDAAGRQYRYWRMRPDGLDAVFYMLRLASLESIFSNEPPAAIEGFEVEDEESTTPTQPGTKDQALPEKTEAVKSRKPTKPKPVSQAPSTDHEMPTLAAIPDGTSQEQVPLSPVLQVESDTGDTDKPTPLVDDGCTPSVDGDTKSLADPQADIVTEHTQSQSIQDPEVLWLRNHGQAGAWLIEIANRISQGQWSWNGDIFEKQGKWLCLFPDVPLKLQVESDVFIQGLVDQNWLVTDVLSPMRKVQTLGQQRVVQLAEEPAQRLLRMIGALPVQASNATPTALPAENVEVKPDKRIDPVNPSTLQKPTQQRNTKAKPRSHKQPAEPPVTSTTVMDSVKPSINDGIPSVQPGQDFPAVGVWISTLRTHPDQQDAWITVSDDELGVYLDGHPDLKRYEFLREISQHPDCQVLGRGQGIKVRIKP